jgi:hypothetical protein
MCWWLLFCRFIVVVVVGGCGGSSSCAVSSCGFFAHTEVRNTSMQETHLNYTSICTSFHSEAIDMLSLPWS